MPGRVKWLAIAAVAVVVVLVMGNRDRSEEPAAVGPLDEVAKTTCDGFAEDYPDAKSRTARLALADRTATASSRTDNEAVEDRAGGLGRTAGDDTEWKAAAEALLKACRDSGWVEG